MSDPKKTKAEEEAAALAAERVKKAAERAARRAAAQAFDGTMVLCECGCRWEGPIADSERIELEHGEHIRLKKGHKPPVAVDRTPDGKRPVLAGRVLKVKE